MNLAYLPLDVMRKRSGSGEGGGGRSRSRMAAGEESLAPSPSHCSDSSSENWLTQRQRSPSGGLGGFLLSHGEHACWDGESIPSDRPYQATIYQTLEVMFAGAG